MKILAFDTSSNACSVALLIDEKIIEHHELAPMQQAKIILPIIQRLLDSENLTIKQLDAIAFGCGPGSFTGVRITASVAQGLAYTAEIPLIPVSSLAAIAQATYQDLGWKKIVVAIDARMNEVYWASYEVHENQLVRLKGKEHVSQPSAIHLPEENVWYGVGNAWEVYDALITAKPIQKSTNQLPTAKALLALAKQRFLQGDTVSVREAIPVYLRDDVAKKIADQ